MRLTTTPPDQADVFAWVQRTFPDMTAPIHRAAKLAEEAGEVVGAVIKIAEGRKTKFDLADELGDLMLCALALADSAGIDLLAAAAMRWEYVNRG